MPNVVRPRFVAISSSLLLLGACGPENEAVRLGSLHAAVVGGQPSTSDQDAVVVLFRGPLICTGTIVAPNLILTARHCLFASLSDGSDFLCREEGGSAPVVNSFDPTSFSVYTGREVPLTKADARGAFIHSSPDLDLCRNDLALLELDQPLAIDPLPLRLDGPVREGEVGLLIGWGATLDDLAVAPPASAHLRARQQREIRVETLGPNNYGAADGRVVFIQEADFVGSEGGCFGDSGAPLVSTETGAIIGVQHAVANLESDSLLDDSLSYCAGAVTLVQRLDAQQEWLRRAFRRAGASLWLEGKRRPVGVGVECDNPDDCISGLCVSAGATSVCSLRCDDTPCPDAMACVGPPSARLCVPDEIRSLEDPPARCTATAQPGRFQWPLIGVLIMTVRRRWRRAPSTAHEFSKGSKCV